MMDQLALDLYLAALCAIGFLAWIARDVTANIVGHIGKPAGPIRWLTEPAILTRGALHGGDWDGRRIHLQRLPTRT
jgi:hypothetical protein